MPKRDVIVIGASAGGVQALRMLFELLPADLPASMFVTLHIRARGKSVLARLLDQVSPMTVLTAQDHAPVQPGKVYVAPPNHHLLFRDGHVVLGHGPKENLQRPCINVMFRSAAQEHGSRVIGALLTGMLDDGAAGLWEIRQHGGLTMAQNPAEAQFSSMPESAIVGGAAEYVVSIEEMATLIRSMAGTAVLPMSDPHRPSSTGDRQQVCPECGGLMQVVSSGGPTEYVCHVGHRMGLKTLIAAKTETIERSLWNGASQLEELIWALEASRKGEPQPTAETIDNEIRTRREKVTRLRQVLGHTAEASLP